MTRYILTFLFLSTFGIHPAVHAQVAFETSAFSFQLDEKGTITELTDTRKGVNYAAEAPAFLLGIKADGSLLDPVGFKSKGEQLSYSYPGGLRVDLLAQNKGDYLRFEVTGLSDEDRIDAVVWGPIRTSIGETVGEFVGVVRNRDYAIGIQALNVKTTGGALIDDQGFVAPVSYTHLRAHET